jgi:uncharacterized protein (DUF433 family)
MLTIDHEPLIKHIEPIDPKHLEGDLIQPNHSLFGVIWINPERVSGTPCFYASRVPISTLFNCIAAGETLDQFLDDFEGVTREQALVVLSLAQSQLLSELPTP